jgi:uncharacterized membrane protein
LVPILLPIHVTAGILAMVFGYTALVARKGGYTHRRIGLLFVYAMLVMGTFATLLAIRKSWTDANVMGGFLSAYFVLTGLTTVRPVSTGTRWLNAIAFCIAIPLALMNLLGGVTAWPMPHHALHGVPAVMMFFLAAVIASAVAGDVRVMSSGPLRGAPRVRRHLWRMCFALFIAAGSFFSIKARVARIMPAEWVTPAVQIAPILLVFVAMFYWLWRVRGRRPVPQRQ